MNIDILNFLMEYLNVIILGICLCVGYVIKTSIPKINNSYIPLIMAILGFILSVCINGNFSAETILIGLFSGLASTGLHQAFTRILDENKKENKKGE